MDELKIFESQQFGRIRTSMTKQREPLFCLSDVCKALELTNPSDVKRRLQQWGVCTIDTPTNGGNQQMTFITEPNLYKCIFQSRKKEAEAFQDWVCSDVLPSIRRDGGYMVSREDESEEDLMARALVVAKNALKRREERIKQLEHDKEKLSATVTEMRQQVSYIDTILSCKDTVHVTSIAQDYGMSAKAFNLLLRNYRIQHKVGQTWVLYRQYLTQGYVQSETFTYQKSDGTQGARMNTKWTQRGRLFLYNTLKGQGILPMIERAIVTTPDNK